jgi:hypothetical protein
MAFIIKTFIVFSTIVFGLNSCKKDCYTCKAENFGNLVDFDENCGSEDEKTQMETDFRKQYPDSIYFVHCD